MEYIYLFSTVLWISILRMKDVNAIYVSPQNMSFTIEIPTGLTM